MSRTGVGCRVQIDGKLLDDGCITWSTPPTVPTVGQGVSAESGLVVTWGRSTTIDQPSASACTFTVTDDPGGVSVLHTIAIGAKVDVYADAKISGGTGTSAFDDPSFTTALRATTTNATATRTQAKAYDAGGWSAALGAVDSTALATVRFPPSTLQEPGTNPAAWAHLPATNPGETWTISVRVWVPDGVTARVRPVLYSGPYATAATVLASPSVAVTTPGGWQLATLTFAPGTAATWVGFQVEISGGLTWAQVAAASTWGNVGVTTWADLGVVFVDAVSILPPSGGTASTVQVFSGRITDLEGFYDDGVGQASMKVTASDYLADLGNRYVGDEPWALETVTSRMTRILSLAAIPSEPAVSVDIAPTLAGINLTLMDVDRRAAAGLLTDIAHSVDGVLWSASHPVIGFFMRLEDPAQRLALYALALVGGKIVIVPLDFTNVENPPPALSACDILRDPVSFVMNVSDVSTRVNATYQEQPIAPATDTTERNVDIVYQALETQYGSRAVSIQTDLTTAADTTRVAEQIIARLGASWRVEGIVFADADVSVPDAAAAKSLMTLLNAVTRGGQALLLTDLDTWSPIGDTAPVYLEGGSYSFVEGGWSLSLAVSRATGVGRSVAWDEIPNTTAWIWDAWDPAITWDDLRGVAAPVAVLPPDYPSATLFPSSTLYPKGS